MPVVHLLFFFSNFKYSFYTKAKPKQHEYKDKPNIEPKKTDA